MFTSSSLTNIYCICLKTFSFNKLQLFFMNALLKSFNTVYLEAFWQVQYNNFIPQVCKFLCIREFKTQPLVFLQLFSRDIRVKKKNKWNNFIAETYKYAYSN